MKHLNAGAKRKEHAGEMTGRSDAGRGKGEFPGIFSAKREQRLQRVHTFNGMRIEYGNETNLRDSSHWLK